jgi:hypothetical protein
MVQANKTTEVLVYRVDDVRRVLGCGRPAAYRLVKQLGKRVGRRYIVSKIVFDAWLMTAERLTPKPRGSGGRRTAA